MGVAVYVTVPTVDRRILTSLFFDMNDTGKKLLLYLTVSRTFKHDSGIGSSKLRTLSLTSNKRLLNVTGSPPTMLTPAT